VYSITSFVRRLNLKITLTEKQHDIPRNVIVFFFHLICTLFLFNTITFCKIIIPWQITLCWFKFQILRSKIPILRLWALVNWEFIRHEILQLVFQIISEGIIGTKGVQKIRLIPTLFFKLTAVRTQNEHLTTDRTINSPLILPRTTDYSSLNCKAPRRNISDTTPYYIFKKHIFLWQYIFVTMAFIRRLWTTKSSKFTSARWRIFWDSWISLVGCNHSQRDASFQWYSYQWPICHYV